MSLVLPTVGIGVAFLLVASASRGVGGDMVGGAVLIYAVVALGVVAFFGIASAIRAIRKEERMVAIAVLGLLLNSALIAIGGFYATIFIR